MKAAFDEIKAYITSNQGTGYRGEPIVIGIEPRKEGSWTQQDYLNLDALIKAELGAMVFGPQQLGADPNDPSKEWASFNTVPMRDVENKVIIRSPARELQTLFDSGIGFFTPLSDYDSHFDAESLK